VEVLDSRDIFIGVNAIDYSGYPDCRPEFILEFERLAKVATKAGVQGKSQFKIHAPLINLSKAETIRKGTRLGVDYSLTLSCYGPSATPDAHVPESALPGKCAARSRGHFRCPVGDGLQLVPALDAWPQTDWRYKGAQRQQTKRAYRVHLPE
jgi:7-cyano-7-deazaguanine synthase in queuosine biosynthesis